MNSFSGCYSQRKVKNSESKSQLPEQRVRVSVSCYSQRKVKNSESKSQQERGSRGECLVVIHSVKLKILKANHNIVIILVYSLLVVIHSVKLKILKANHNKNGCIPI